MLNSDSYLLQLPGSQCHDRIRTPALSNAPGAEIHQQRQRRTSALHIPPTISMPPRSLRFWFLLLLLIVLPPNTTGQNTLSPTVNSSSTYLVEQTPANLTCVLNTNATPTSGDFPLSWSRNGGLPASATVSNSLRQGNGDIIIYTSVLAFTPTPLDNNVVITCAARVDSLTGSASNTPQLILVADNPVITGPDTVDASVSTVWTCEVDGASRNAPNVYWRNGDGAALTSGVTKSTNLGIEPNQNRIYNITQTIRISLNADQPSYKLSCISVHAYDQYASYKTSTKTITIYFPPQITKSGGDLVYTNQGEQTALSCIILFSNPSATNVSWTKNGEPLDFSSGRFSVVSPTSSNLVISSAVRSDRGDYLCTVTNSRGSTSFINATTLLVKYPPTVNNTGNGTTVGGSIGGSMTLPCPVDAVPAPTAIVWKRIVNGQIQVVNVTGSLRYRGGTTANKMYDLTIDPVEADDAGVYFCQAVNDLGTGTGQNITTVVNNNPLVIVPTNLTVTESDNFTIYCQISLSPPITSVTWFKGNYQLNIIGSSGKFSGGTVQTPSLTVYNASWADADRFRCQAANGTTTAFGSTLVIVSYAPRVSLTTADVIGSAGGLLTLHCMIDALPPVTNVTWKKLTTGVTNTTEIVTTGGRFSGGNVSEPSLTINNLQPADVGLYFCEASNSIGGGSSGPLNVHVMYKPILTVTSAPAIVSLGSPFSLTCTAQAYPAVTRLVWLRGDQLVADTANFSQLQANITDYTDFRCSATNSEGNSSASIKPNIQFAPQRVGSGQATVTAKKGSTVTLQCLVLANPPPDTYNWYKKGMEVAGQTQWNLSLTLGTNDFTDYNCSAENSLGSLNPAREFTVVEDKGAPLSKAGLSSGIITMIVLIIFFLLLLLLLLIIWCCCKCGICAKERNTATVKPSLAPGGFNNDNGDLISKSPPPPFSARLDEDTDVDVKPEVGGIQLEDGGYKNPYMILIPPSQISPRNNGSIISVPDKGGPRPYHLPPLDPDTEIFCGPPSENEKRRSRKKKPKKPEKEDERNLTEDRSDTSSPTV